MRAILILIVALVYSTNFAMAETRSFSTIQPLVPNYYNGYSQPVAQPITSYDDLSQMEISIFNRTYRDVLIKRIARLETKMFGSVQQGDVNQRYISLQNAINQYNLSKYNQQNFYSAPATTAQSGWKGILGNLGGIILGNSMGYPTGYSPQIDPYSVINNNGIGSLGGYGSSGASTNNNGVFGSGYSNYNSGMGMGSGVRIMY